ncbi:hypothetical protein UFOVP336_66 [uncultured Caudovirales phage]|uniref:Uncharacterized protein n=1 Tax=uncultured Caudovirales phage TaxID=2100421 RepID=A0A6J5M2L1_9CAUD|nr:hypothetical protein UFOVP336_66 [uncultured Caudovirales phage]
MLLLQQNLAATNKVRIYALSVTASAGGVTYNQSLSATLTLSGTVSRVVNKVVSGVVTTSSTLLKNISKGVVGALTATGTLIKNTATRIAGSITTSAGPVTGGIFAQSASGSITLSSVLTDAVTFVRSYGSSITLSGTLAKPVYKLLTGSIALVGSVFKLVTKVAFTASMTLTGALSAFSFTPGVGGGVLGRGLRFMRKFIGRR